MHDLAAVLGSLARSTAYAIWRAGVDAVRPERCLPAWFHDAASWPPHFPPLASFDRILVVGGGKAGVAMSRALEAALTTCQVPLDRVTGLVNVPNKSVVPLQAIRLHPARPAGTNHPTEAGVVGTQEILRLAELAGPNDLLVSLISGGGSALLPAPVDGVSLADKQQLTQLLHECGATIQEMNAVRKHLSRIKGGGLVRHFQGRYVLGLIISDVIGDPLDVIASGPTAIDPTTFADAWAVLACYQLLGRAPRSIIAHLEDGRRGRAAETLKEYPRDAEGRPRVANVILANNAMSLSAAEQHAAALGYHAVNLGPNLSGDTGDAARTLADQVLQKSAGKNARRIVNLSGGETTVTMPFDHGLGGRNQEFALAFVNYLGIDRMDGVTILCGGTDGEDGPTDAAGAVADVDTLRTAARLRLSPADYLTRHDSYHFFEQTGGLLKTGLTDTNVMDLRIIIVE